MPCLFYNKNTKRTRTILQVANTLFIQLKDCVIHLYPNHFTTSLQIFTTTSSIYKYSSVLSFNSTFPKGFIATTFIPLRNTHSSVSWEHLYECPQALEILPATLNALNVMILPSIVQPIMRLFCSLPRPTLLSPLF